MKSITKKIFKNTTKVFYSYEDIPLRLYMHIASTGNYFLLCSKGIPTVEECSKCWESIVKENEKSSGGFLYSTYLELLQSYQSILAESNFVRSSLVLCLMFNDDKIIEELADLGYVIDRSGESAYNESLKNAIHRSSNLGTQLLMKANEIRELAEQQGGGALPNFEQVIARICIDLKFEVKEDITLARYNEYCSILKSRRKHDNKEE